MYTSIKHPDYAIAIMKLAMRKPMAALAALLFVLLPASVLAQQDQKPVSLYLNVEESDNLITGLESGNFTLKQDGKPLEFELKQPEGPAVIALLLEFSQNAMTYINDMDDVMQGFADVAPDGNWYAFATYSNVPTVRVDFTKKPGRIVEAYSELNQPMWTGSDTYDAIYDMLDKMGRMSGRRVLVVISSGLDDFSHHTLQDVQKKIEETNVLVYCITLGSAYRGTYQPYLTNSDQMDLLMAQNFMRMLADYSGGQAWFPNEEGAYPDIVKGMFQDLKYQYEIVYTPDIPSDGKFHELKVEAFQIKDGKKHDFKVRVRKGWRY